MYEPPPGHRKPWELRDEDKGNIITWIHEVWLRNAGPLHICPTVWPKKLATFEQLLAPYIDVATTLLVRLHDFKVYLFCVFFWEKVCSTDRPLSQENTVRILSLKRESWIFFRICAHFSRNFERHLSFFRTLFFPLYMCPFSRSKNRV